MRIGCFGISANPPHLGHLDAVRVFLSSGLVDQIWFIPSYNHPFDKPELVEWQHRFNMCLLLEGENNLRIATADVEYEMQIQPHYAIDKSYTVHVLAYLRRKYPQFDFIWCVGSDVISDGLYKQWYMWKTLEQEERILVAHRVEYPLPEGPMPKPFFRLGHVRNISSTKIREMIRAGEDVSEFTGEEVATYIKEHGLYLPRSNGGANDNRIIA